jgi:cell division protein ZapA
MAHVTVTINGKPYRMACNEGEEAHLTALAERFNSHVGRLKGSFGEIGDQRLTVMAGIMVTDELQEASRRLQALERELAEARSGRDAAIGEALSAERQLAERISDAALRIESIAERLAHPRGK